MKNPQTIDTSLIYDQVSKPSAPVDSLSHNYQPNCQSIYRFQDRSEKSVMFLWYYLKVSKEWRFFYFDIINTSWSTEIRYAIPWWYDIKEVGISIIWILWTERLNTHVIQQNGGDKEIRGIKLERRRPFTIDYVFVKCVFAKYLLHIAWQLFFFDEHSTWLFEKVLKSIFIFSAKHCFNNLLQTLLMKKYE